MSELKDIEKQGVCTESGQIAMGEPGGLSFLLTSPFALPPAQQGERRSGCDRRIGDRRVRAREFLVPE